MFRNNDGEEPPIKKEDGETPFGQIRERQDNNNASIPKWIADFYRLISKSNNFKVGKIIELINAPTFTLEMDANGMERQYAPEQFEEFHDHCFETPLLAISHIASQHELEMNANQLTHILKRLLELNANIHAKDEDGNTPVLLLAASVCERTSLLDAIQFLYEAGADINETNNEGETVLHQAFELMNFSLAHDLYLLGAKVIMNDQNNSFLLAGEDNVTEEIAKNLEPLIKLLKTMHLLGDLPESEDTVYKAISTTSELSHKAIRDVIKKDPVITERSLTFVIKELQDEDILSMLLLSLNNKLNRIYTWQPTLYGTADSNQTSLHKTDTNTDKTPPDNKNNPEKNIKRQRI